MPNNLWKTSALCRAISAKKMGDLPSSITGISIDSRSLLPGEAFFALQGKQDGHQFLPAAFEKGASLAVISQNSAEWKNRPCLQVEDGLQALWDLAKAARDRSPHTKRIAITGSVGKTSTKEALRNVLSQQARTHASKGSHNNHIGVPLSLAGLPKEAQYGIFEIGTNHKGEVEPLTRLIQPQVAIITTVDSAHIGNFLNEEELVDEKSSIFLGMEKGGIAILHRDNPHYERMHAKALFSSPEKILTFGQHRKADIRLEEAFLFSDHSQVNASINGKKATYTLSTPGQAWVTNSLIVLAVTSLLDLSIEAALSTLSKQSALKGRGEQSKLPWKDGWITLIDQSHNATPPSMKEAISVLGKTQATGKRIAVLGSMLELGSHSDILHRSLLPYLLQESIDLVFCFGERMQILWKEIPPKKKGGYTTNLRTLEEWVGSCLEAGDVLMIKGSFSTQVSELVAYLKTESRKAEPSPRESETL